MRPLSRSTVSACEGNQSLSSPVALTEKTSPFALRIHSVPPAARRQVIGTDVSPIWIGPPHDAASVGSLVVDRMTLADASAIHSSRPIFSTKLACIGVGSAHWTLVGPIWVSTPSDQATYTASMGAVPRDWKRVADCASAVGRWMTVVCPSVVSSVTSSTYAPSSTYSVVVARSALSPSMNWRTGPMGYGGGTTLCTYGPLPNRPPSTHTSRP